MAKERVIIPGAGDNRALRDAFGSFTTGVTVVTAAGPSGPVGMTANSFTSVSLEPPLVLWSAARSSSRHATFRAAAHFAIHVLGQQQEAIAMAFARSAFSFDGVDWQTNGEGVPVITGTLACFECRLHAVHDAGDHSLLIGEVMRATLRNGAPLCFANGRFGSFSAFVP